ncbi:MAG TPA: hypothetical protein VIL85_17830 [Thermomicrobiales bacterium]
MDHYHGILLAEYAARERNQRLEAAAERWAQRQELPAEPTMRVALAERLLALAVWVAPDHTLPTIQRAAVKHLAHSS